MNNYSIFSPSNSDVDFNITAEQLTDSFTTSSSGVKLYLRIRALDTEVDLRPGELEQGVLYEIAAFSNPTYETAVAIDSWEGSNVNFIQAYIFTPDKRPLYVTGYATQTTDVDPRNEATSGKICGVTNTSSKPYRMTPKEDGFDQPADPIEGTGNGRINWVDDEVAPAVQQGFERVHWINIGGHTNFNGSQLNAERQNAGLADQTPYKAMQPHYPSLVAGSMEFDEYVYIIDSDNLSNAVIAATPFTTTGQPDDSEGRGDSKKAWRAAVQYTRDLGATEITSYQGYRPVYTDASMENPLLTITSLSAQSSGNADSKKDRWTGTGNSPGFCPEPGFDGTSGEPLVEKVALFWDDEIRGILNLGFNGIGLDTGTRVYDNGAGRANGNNSALPNLPPESPDGVGNLSLINYFNGFGIKPMFEAVGLNTWEVGGGLDAGPDLENTDRYDNSAYWAFFGSWWGYTGSVEGSDGYIDVTGASFTSNSQTPSGGFVYRDDATGDTYIGNNPVTRDKMPATAEVHVVVQWGSATHLATLLKGEGTDMNGNKLTFIGLKQMLYDMYDAGLVISASGHPTQEVEGITASEFRQYILDLNNGLILKRPASDVKIAEMTATGGLTLNLWANGTKAWRLTGGKSWDTSGHRGTVEDNNGAFDTIALPVLGNGVELKVASFYYNNATPPKTATASDCFALHMTSTDSGLPFYELEKQVFMNITVVGDDGDGNDVTHTAKLSDWGNLGSDTPDPPDGVTTLVNRTPSAIPGDPNDIPWTDVAAQWRAGQPTIAPFDLAASTVTIELWQEG